MSRFFIDCPVFAWVFAWVFALVAAWVFAWVFVSAWIGTAFVQDDAAGVLASMKFSAQHQAKLHATNPIERLDGEIKRRTDGVGMSPDEAAVTD